MKSHRNFEPGLIYVIYGEVSARITKTLSECGPSDSWYRSTYGRIPPHAWKIGMTKHTPEHRMLSGKREWVLSENLQVVHTITVDNMRVVETMFHQRYDEYKIAWNPRASVWEWFNISNKITGLKLCKNIDVMASLQDLAGRNDPCLWWWALEAFERRQYAAKLWRHPLTKITLNRSHNTR